MDVISPKWTCWHAVSVLASSHLFPSLGRLRRTHLSPYAPHYHPWSSVATFDTLQIAPGSVVGAYMEEELEIIVTVSDELWQSLHNIPEAAKFLQMTCQISKCCPDCIRELPTTVTHWFKYNTTNTTTLSPPLLSPTTLPQQQTKCLKSWCRPCWEQWDRRLEGMSAWVVESRMLSE